MTNKTNLAAAVLIAAAIISTPQLGNARDRLVVTQWGGIWGEALDKYVVVPFQKKYDVEVTILRAASSSALFSKIRAEKSRPTVDVYFASFNGAMTLAKEGIAEELPLASVPAVANVSPTLISKLDGKIYFAGINTRTSGIMIRHDLVKPPAEVTMKWLLSPSLKRQVAIPNMAYGDGLLLLASALANGGNESNIDPGFVYLKQLAPNIKAIFQSTGEASRMLSTGEASVAYVSSSSTANMKSSGMDVGFYVPKDMPLFLAADAIMAVKGGPAGRDLALKFINFFLEPDQINSYSFAIGSSSPLKDAPTPSKDQVAVPISNEQMNQAYFAKAETANKISAGLDKWDERFKREIQPAIGQ